jgi:hypothetical protein
MTGTAAQWTTRAATAVALVITTATPIDSARWWISPRWASRLRLSAAQVHRIEELYSASRPERTALLLRTQAARARVEMLLASDARDASVETAALDAADAESAYRRARTVMLYRIIRVLSAEQRAALARVSPPRVRRESRTVPVGTRTP